MVSSRTFNVWPEMLPKWLICTWYCFWDWSCNLCCSSVRRRIVSLMHHLNYQMTCNMQHKIVSLLFGTQTHTLRQQEQHGRPCKTSNVPQWRTSTIWLTTAVSFFFFVNWRLCESLQCAVRGWWDLHMHVCLCIHLMNNCLNVPHSFVFLCLCVWATLGG